MTSCQTVYQKCFINCIGVQFQPDLPTHTHTHTHTHTQSLKVGSEMFFLVIKEMNGDHWRVLRI